MNMAVPLPGDSRAVSGTKWTLPFSPRGIAASSGRGSILQHRLDWRSPVQNAVGATRKLHLSASQSTLSRLLYRLSSYPFFAEFSPLRNAEECPPAQCPEKEIKTPVRYPSTLRRVEGWAGDPEPGGRERRRDSRHLPVSPGAPPARSGRSPRARGAASAVQRRRCCPGQARSEPAPDSAAPLIPGTGRGRPAPPLLLRAPVPPPQPRAAELDLAAEAEADPGAAAVPRGPGPGARWGRRAEREGRRKALSPPLPPQSSPRQALPGKPELSDTSDRKRDRLRKLVFQHLTQVKPQRFETQGGRERGAWEWRDFIPDVLLGVLHRSYSKTSAGFKAFICEAAFRSGLDYGKGGRWCVLSMTYSADGITQWRMNFVCLLKSRICP